VLAGIVGALLAVSLIAFVNSVAWVLVVGDEIVEKQVDAIEGPLVPDAPGPPGDS